jgi:hypothetical protein
MYERNAGSPERGYSKRPEADTILGLPHGCGDFDVVIGRYVS